MTKIFLYAAAFLLLGSLVLSYANKGKLNAKQADIVRVTGERNGFQADANKATAGRKDAEKKLGEANSKNTDLQGELTAATASVTKLNDQIAEAGTQIKAKDTEIARLNDAVKSAATGITPAPGADDMTAKLKEAETQRDELKTVKEGLESQVKGMQGQVAELQRKENDRRAGIAAKGLAGRILAVDRNWNFVVLDLGDRNGIVNNATMIVRRGSSMVGKVRVTSVEPSQSIADIVPNSVPSGINVQPGDTVIYPGS